MEEGERVGVSRQEKGGRKGLNKKQDRIERRYTITSSTTLTG